jgi:hypothetical protein
VVQKHSRSVGNVHRASFTAIGKGEREKGKGDIVLIRKSRMSPFVIRVFELRCFGGLDVKETATVLDISAATVKNDWRFARAWLASQLEPGQES